MRQSLGKDKGMDGETFISGRKGGSHKICGSSFTSFFDVLLQITSRPLWKHYVTHSSILVGEQERQEETMLGSLGFDDPTEKFGRTWLSGYRNLQLGTFVSANLEIIE